VKLSAFVNTFSPTTRVMGPWKPALLFCMLGLVALANAEYVKPGRHTFTFGGPDNSEFRLDGQSFRIRSGEMHPDRIPPEYWRHRLQMAKAMGLNTIAIYVFWNAHEPKEGHYDFTSAPHDIGRFLRLAREEGLWVLLRPGAVLLRRVGFWRHPDLSAALSGPEAAHACGLALYESRSQLSTRAGQSRAPAPG